MVKIRGDLVREKASFEIFGSQQFIDWLNTEKLSLAFTTYQSNRLFFIGIKPDGSLSATMRTFDRPMGLYATADRLTLATRYQVWQLENMVEKGQLFKDRDKMYVPCRSWMTGQLDIHDIVQAKWGDNPQQVIFVNTLFDCLATLSDRYSFTPLWKPPFISKVTPEERCHLNGLAIVDGKPAYLTTPLAKAEGILSRYYATPINPYCFVSHDSDQRYILWGQVKVPLHSRLKSKPCFAAYFCLNVCISR
ncbi:MAG: DUF4915 domain-containing protein [Okeania sp. SIO3B5]|uniref:DUF4915 domain-containing protein n=1 Tax=Okeania sp. SIO3B5 TaxID=2607811 RepID=UPI0013FF9DD1|nr:DUF4915 domain-containing protein [Okeania sp. SIO3B5]NEO57270.1 DUF4915 domain-containing protein [Okeania sp. SIO3B5]